jgi:glycine/D-amino acid oxidase-like deaminating enzyme
LKVAVVGGGAFGAMAALRLAEGGHAVTLFERQPALMMGASYNNQNRLHLGYHYPRDDETARQCIRGFGRFVKEFGSCVLSGFTNAYFIASEGSRTTPEDFISFCQRLDLECPLVDLETFAPQVRGVEMGVYTSEFVYDSALVRLAITDRLTHSNVDIRAGEGVTALAHDGGGYRIETPAGAYRFDAVINACYYDINRLTSALGHATKQQQYEYTAVPIIELDLPQTTGITIMDGPFMTVLPFGKSGRYLLYHVDHAVIASHDGVLMNPAWLDRETAPFATVDREAWFAGLVERCAPFVPAVRNARPVDYLQGPRMVLANNHATDSRPSTITQHEPGYITIFSGKIDHCTWVADDVAAMIAAL